MKSWCDLSWNEKCDIEEGEVNPFDYLSGYSFDVKTRVQEGQKKLEENNATTKSQNRTRSQ